MKWQTLNHPLWLASTSSKNPLPLRGAPNCDELRDVPTGTVGPHESTVHERTPRKKPEYLTSWLLTSWTGSVGWIWSHSIFEWISCKRSFPVTNSQSEQKHVQNLTKLPFQIPNSKNSPNTKKSHHPPKKNHQLTFPETNSSPPKKWWFPIGIS